MHTISHERLTIERVKEILDNHEQLQLGDEAIAQRLADYKNGLKAKIEKANKDLAEVKYEYKTN